MSETPQEHSREETVEVQVRRAPKVGVFLFLGAIIGFIVALVLTYAFDGSVSPTGFAYSKNQVLGFLALWCVPIGAAILGLIAAWIDARSRKRAKTVRADHFTETDEAV